MEKNTAEQRQNLAELLQNRARGALVRAQFSMSNEMDAPTSFFLLVGKMTGHMHCLHLPDRQVTCEQSEMREVAVDFYKTLYATENCDPACVGDQTYCVPARSIHDNLHLFCDIMDLAKLSNVNLGLLSWIRRRPLTEWTMATCLRLYTLLEWESFLLLG